MNRAEVSLGDNVGLHGDKERRTDSVRAGKGGALGALCKCLESHNNAQHNY
jgi:hypothetical protein